MNNNDALLLFLGVKELPPKNAPEWETPPIDDAQKIVKELGCLPLAVDLARGYIHHTRTSLKEYLSMFNKERDVLFTYRDESILDQYEHTITTVWRLSFERLRHQDPVAAQILD